MSHRFRRRKLLQGTLAAGTLTILPAGLARGYAANETVNLGIIGVGGMGGGNRAWFKRIGGWSVVPESKRAEIHEPARFLPRVSDHKVEWLEAIKGGKPASSNFTDYSSHLAEVVLLGNVAIRTGTKIEWNGVNLKAKNCPAADQYIRREYRKGWDV